MSDTTILEICITYTKYPYTCIAEPDVAMELTAEGALNEFKNIHEQFGQKCESTFQPQGCHLLTKPFSGLLHDKYTEGIGNSLFTHSNGMSSNSYYDEYWEPEFDAVPEIPENV